MKVMVVTGGASGIGAAIKKALVNLGVKVIVVDIHSADIEADLSTHEGRERAITGMHTMAPEGLDGFIACAGLGPNVTPYSLITEVNYFAARALTEGVVSLLEKKQGNIVIMSSNSASMPGLNREYVDALMENDEDKACQLVNTLDGHNAYAGSKLALTRWMRHQAPRYAKKGIRINAIAPGIVQTALTDKVMSDNTLGGAMKDFADSVPAGRMGQPNDIADSVLFLLSEQASFIIGSVLFVDGGHDAMLRPDKF